jgi:oligopeptide transport system ATP-binding protein
MDREAILTVKNLKTYYPVKAGVFQKTVGHVKAVDDVSFHINQGETVGLVGESGCGKSTLGATILRLTKATSGQIFFQGKDVLALKSNKLFEYRRKTQIVFQDPYASLNPRMTIADIIGEPMEIHRLVQNKRERNQKVADLLAKVGMTATQMGRYPHEFSGGQRQRIAIARALAVEPQLVIADEPVSALDVSIQAQVINILQDLQKEFGLTYLFVSHGLSVVKHISDRVIVMYLGKIVEMAAKDDLYTNPLHPYTQSLISAIPIPNPNYQKNRIILEGDVPSPLNPPAGCRFHPRCSKAMEICRNEEPVLRDTGNHHWVACYLENKSIIN